MAIGDPLKTFSLDCSIVAVDVKMKEKQMSKFHDDFFVVGIFNHFAVLESHLTANQIGKPILAKQLQKPEEHFMQLI